MDEKQGSCAICFQTYNESTRSNFIELSARDYDSKTYLDKIQYLISYEIVSIVKITLLRINQCINVSCRSYMIVR